MYSYDLSMTASQIVRWLLVALSLGHGEAAINPHVPIFKKTAFSTKFMTLKQRIVSETVSDSLGEYD